MDPRLRQKRLVQKHLCYLGLVALFYLLGSIPGLFALFGIKPVWLIGLAVCIAGREGEFTGALYGAIAGLFWEVGAGRTAGSLSLMLLCCCFVCGVVVILFLQPNVVNMTWLCGVSCFVITGIDHIFVYWMRDGGDTMGIYFLRTLPVVLYTGAVTVIPWLLVRWVWQRFLIED